MDFEALLKGIVVLAAGGFVCLMLGLGVKLLFLRRPRLTGTVEPEILEEVEERLRMTEGKMIELEERLDFAERMLTEVRAKAQLPGS